MMPEEDYSALACIRCAKFAPHIIGGLCEQCEEKRLDEIANPRELRCALCMQSIVPCTGCRVRNAIFRTALPNRGIQTEAQRLRTYETWKDEQVTAELNDQFFLHEMGISPCDLTNDRIDVYPVTLSWNEGGDE